MEESESHAHIVRSFLLTSSLFSFSDRTSDLSQSIIDRSDQKRICHSTLFIYEFSRDTFFSRLSFTRPNDLLIDSLLLLLFGMNLPSSSYGPSEKVLRRFRLWKRQYLHVVIYTSLFWIFVDVFVIMLFTDCTKEIIVPCSASRDIVNQRPLQPVAGQPRFPLDASREKNGSQRLNLLNKKKILQTKKSTGFIAKWFGSGSGTNPSSWPGEGGRAVLIPANLKDEAKNRFKENQFNIVASDLMALNRSINDQRSSRFVSSR